LLGFDCSFVESMDDVVSELQSVGQIFERKSVLWKSAQASKVGHSAEREDEVVVRNDVRMGMKSWARHDRSCFEVERFDLSHVETSAWKQPSDRAHHVEKSDRAGDHLWQHRLKNEVVLLVDQHDFNVAPVFELLLEGARSVNSCKPPSHDDNAFWFHGNRSFASTSGTA